MKIENLKEFYRNKLARKERLIDECIEEKNSIEGFKSLKREIEYNSLYSEIELIKIFLEDLRDLE